jgi:PAS domain S-box-containing protein
MELLGRSIQEVEGRETPEQVKRHLHQLKREGGGRFETMHRAKDGRLVALELNVTFIPNRGRLIAFCHEITDRPPSPEASAKARPDSEKPASA